MVPIVSLLVILSISVLVTRIASVLLEHTGLSRDSARFQARSAFTGVGFTTREAEQIVDHPVRRRVVGWLMLVGNVGTVSAMAAVLVSAIDLQSSEGVGVLVAVLAAGLALLWLLGSNAWVDRKMCSLIRFALRHFTSLDTQDYGRLLHLRDEYGVSSMRVDGEHWLAGRTLADSELEAEGLVVLGIECPGGSFVGAPAAAVEIRAGDEIVVYGQAARLAELGTRERGGAGDGAHAEARAEREERVQAERSSAER
jgi:hypothetical protein